MESLLKVKSLFFVLFSARFTTTNLIAAMDSVTKSCASPKIQFIAFDFDKTCTTRMILDMYKTREDYHGGMKTKLDKEWEKLEELYLEYTKDITVPTVVAKEGQTNNKLPVNKQFDESGLRQFLERYREVDLKMTGVVTKSGIMKGITEANLKEFAKGVELKPHLLAVLETFKFLGIPLYVISLNFSQKLIENVLNSKGTLSVTVHTNKLGFENGVSTGTIGTTFVSAFDKETDIQRIKDHNSKERCGISIYVGDSYNDLLALLSADVGFIIGQNKAMQQMCRHYGIKVEEYKFESVQTKLDSEQRRQPILFAVDSWNEIKDFVLQFS